MQWRIWILFAVVSWTVTKKFTATTFRKFICTGVMRDIDFAAVVKGERKDLQRRRNKVLDETVRMDLEYDVITSPKVIPASDFEKYGEELPYYRNIKREGKLLA